MPGWARRLVVAGVAAWAGAAVLLVLPAVDVELPGPSETTQVGPISRVAVIYSHLALAMAAAALVVAARRSERRGREIVVLLIALLGARAVLLI